MACQRLGILGGTFDPVHIGHLIVAEEVRVLLDLRGVLFVPARVSPLKLQQIPASPEHRLRMVELAIQDNPCFSVSRIDVDRVGPSFTVDTLKEIREACGAEAQLYFIMGADSLESLKSWRSPEKIIRLARLAAVSRPGFPLDMEMLEKDLPGISQATELITTLDIGISATDIRHRVGQGLSIKYQVPALVESYIRRYRLYERP